MGFYLPRREQSWSMRSAGIGKGNKYDFTKMVTNTPGPGNYNVKAVEDALGRKKKFTMGVGREAVFLNGMHPEFQKKFGVPGPGHYGLKEQLSRIGTRFGRSLPPAAPNNDIPGPGEYRLPETISKNGKYFVSNLHGSGAPRIPLTTADGQVPNRFVYHLGTKTPAPGSYADIDAINVKGQYRISRLRNTSCGAFGREKRNIFNLPKPGTLGSPELTGPGPGSYRLPSEFGIYVSSKAKEAKS